MTSYLIKSRKSLSVYSRALSAKRGDYPIFSGSYLVGLIISNSLIAMAFSIFTSPISSDRNSQNTMPTELIFAVLPAFLLVKAQASVNRARASGLMRIISGPLSNSVLPIVSRSADLRLTAMLPGETKSSSSEVTVQ